MPDFLRLNALRLAAFEYTLRTDDTILSLSLPDSSREEGRGVDNTTFPEQLLTISSSQATS